MIGKYNSYLIKSLQLLVIVILLLSMNITTNKALDQVNVETGTHDTWQLLDSNKAPLWGSNVRVAIIDSGIDWTHPAFYNPVMSMPFNPSFSQNNTPYIDINTNQVHDNGETLIYETVDIVDPAGNSVATASSFDMGIDYLFLDTNYNGVRETWEFAFLVDDTNHDNQLSPQDVLYALGLSKIEKIYDVMNSNIFVRGVDLTNPSINTQQDVIGHGTHVAGIIAGGYPGLTQFTGIAPNATLLVAKAIDDNTGRFPLANLIASLDWAIQEDVDIISMSLGAVDNRYLDGSDAVDLKIDEAKSKGIAVVVSAGNLADKNTHSEISITPSFPVNPTLPSTQVTSVDVNWTLLPYPPSNDDNIPDLEEIRFTVLWKSGYATNIDLVMPDGTMIVVPNTGNVIVPDLNDADNYNVTSIQSMSARGTYKQFIEIRKTSGHFQNPFAGGGDTEFSNINYQQFAKLRISITSSTGGMIPQEFQSYISDNLGKNDGIYTKFTSPSQISPSHTITSPATSDSAISVGSYIILDANPNFGNGVGNISEFSSRGSRIDGKSLPLISAPGEYIISAASRDASNYANSFIYKKGTSMAAPVVSGSIALMLQYQPILTPDQILDILINSTNVDSFVSSWGSVPNEVFGYGKLNTDLAVRNAGSPEFAAKYIPKYYSIGNPIPITIEMFDYFGISKVEVRFSVDGGQSWNINSATSSESDGIGNWTTTLTGSFTEHLLLQIYAEDVFGLSLLSEYIIIAVDNSGSNTTQTITVSNTTTQTTTETVTTTEIQTVTVTNTSGNPSSNQQPTSTSDTSNGLNFVMAVILLGLLQLMYRKFKR